MKGVNLGGWLVLEKWLTPNLFTNTAADDEYTFMQRPGAKAKIENHRQNFITENDFLWLSQQGITLVRIPIGYWLFESIDGYTPTVHYLDNAMSWAAKHNIKVLIDLHAVRGSQNGFDNSGKIGQPRWFLRPDYQQQSLQVLRQIAQRYGRSPALWGIELLNEPKAKRSYWMLIRFYRHAYHELCKILQPGTHIVFHDGFRPLLFAGALRADKNFPVIMDTHLYAFPFQTKSLSLYLKLSYIVRIFLLRYLRLWQPVIVGEWSTVLPQHFFDTRPQNEHLDVLAQNALMQQQAYTHCIGWIYWTYKAEKGGMWNLRSLVDTKTIVL